MISRRAFWTVALSASLVLTGCSRAESPRGYPSSVPSATSPLDLLYNASHLPPERVARLQAEFEKVRTSLANENPNFAATQLRILQGGDTFPCRLGGMAFRVTAFSQSRYCPDGSGGTIVLTPNGMRGAPDVPAIVRFTIQHEFGHARQNLEGTLVDRATTPASSQNVEGQATCYAGVEMALAHRQDIGTVEDFLEQLPSDTLHGSGAMQAEAFMRGVDGGTC